MIVAFPSVPVLVVIARALRRTVAASNDRPFRPGAISARRSRGSGGKTLGPPAPRKARRIGQTSDPQASRAQLS
jgi:hypothetical protein